MTGPAMDWRKRLQHAVALHQAGRLAEAITLYRDVLTERADNSDALHLLGMALEQAGFAVQGRAFVEQAIRNDPQVAAYRNSLGNILRALGDTVAAREAYLAALKRDPHSAEAHDNLGLLDQAAGDWPAAIAHFKAALAIDPALPSAQFNHAATRWLAGERSETAATLAGLLRRIPAYTAQVIVLAKRCAAAQDSAGTEQLVALLGDTLPAAERHFFAGMLARLRGDEVMAEHEFAAALAIDPDHAEALPLLSGLLCARGAYAEAIPLLRRRLAIKPDDHAALTALASACTRLGQYDDALPLLQRALAVRPDDMALLADLAQCCDRVERLDEACDAYYRMIALQPGEALAYANVSGLEVRRGNLAAARKAVDAALSLQPDSATALGNLANICGLEKRFDEAIALYRRLIDRNPQDGNSHNNLALLLLRLGRYAEAWPHFSWRWHSATWTTPDRGRGLPRWETRGQPPGRLLVWREQGIGDEILYASLLPELAARPGSDLVLASDPRLVPLFSRSFPGIRVVADDDTLNPQALGLACQCPAGDLAALLRPDAAAFTRHPQAYLKADPDRRAMFRARYADQEDAEGGKLLVGLSWASRNRSAGHRKSFSLAAMAPILREPGCSFVSLQYGPSVEDIAALQRETGLDLRHDADVDPLRDIDAQAAQIAALDLVVTVSTAAAHLAAGLGIPTLILLPDDWGQLWYWGEEGERSPWYAGVRLCRSQAGQDGGEMIGRAVATFRRMRADLKREGL
ncbi:MAG: tetratricopeptide repeat protein [Ferrovibrio sp.]|uniref:tetratricopeptide repeat protein n=1 Tax=Ferrovibrio sp. TaxID=1917215 RepID=UPI00262EB8E1|nr:tetratricopeptide repeat protein [Ferrovibrio sp.]MCW0233739.1 tetratricopeptide repeat protein [Ferrovibrio sp.]